VETKLPPKVAYTVKVPMTPKQAIIYDWVKATNTIRIDPAGPIAAARKQHAAFASLQNKCMELRKVCVWGGRGHGAYAQGLYN
jgi:SWI/SNF-related matrix-associated actin-dependent regulator of chromatin subfamily A protein 2/4